MDDSILYIRFLLGMLIVVAVGGMSFNRPSWARTYTDWSRYAMAACLFVMVYVLIYVAVTQAVQAVAAELMSSTPSHFALSAPALISVALTIFIAQHRLIDRWLRDKLHELAGVPHVAEHLEHSLVEVPFEPGEERVEAAKLILLRRGIDCDQAWLPPAKVAHELFLKSTIVFLEIRKWDDQHRFADFMTEVRHDFDRLRTRFDRLSLKFARTLGQIERLGDIRRIMLNAGAESNDESTITMECARLDREHVDDKMKKIVNDMLLDLQEDVVAFHRAACRMLARWSLTCRLTKEDRRRELRQYGFALTDKPPAPDYNAFLYATIIIVASVSVFFLVVARAPIVTIPMPALVIVITVVQVGAMAIAIVPKLFWGFANAGIARRTPILFVIGAGLAAMLFFVTVNVVAGLLRLKGWHGVEERLLEALKFMPSAFGTASAMAFLVQDHRWGMSRSQIQRRAFDGLVMAGVWVVATLVSALLGAPLFFFGLLFSAAIGFALGFVVPGSFREVHPAVMPMHATTEMRLPQLQELRRFVHHSSVSKPTADAANAVD